MSKSLVKVTNEGDIAFFRTGKAFLAYLADKDLDAHSHYYIEADRLDESDWVIQMLKKEFCDMNTFIPAYLRACEKKEIALAPVLTSFKFLK